MKDGLKWSEGLKLVDVAFGVQKIIRTAVVNQTLHGRDHRRDH